MPTYGKTEEGGRLMGNRGNVIFTNGERISPCVYLHWNGSAESIYRFLAELDAREVRADAEYEAARFVEIVGEFFSFSGPAGNASSYGLSVGIVNGPSEINVRSLNEDVYTDDSDNGFFVVNRTGEHWKVQRFVNDYPHGLKELSREEVIEERDQALANVEYGEIANFFAELRERAAAVKADA